MSGGLLPRLVTAHLRLMRGGVAWLHDTLGPHIERIVARSDGADGHNNSGDHNNNNGHGALRLDTDSMEAYCCLPDEVRAEVDRDVARGEVPRYTPRYAPRYSRDMRRDIRQS